MTREENLHWLNQEIRTWENECQSKHPIKEALYAARKVLEQKPCEDAVSRTEVLNLVRFNAFHVKSQIKAIENMPSVTPQEPRKGHWIGHREHCENLGVMPSGLGAYEWCSNCDCGIDVREWHRNHYNFCPNCGADMREGEE